MGTSAIVLIVLAGILVNAKTLDSVHVNKCCKFLEILHRDGGECKNSTVENWTINYKTFTMTGFKNGLPINWKIAEGSPPKCTNFSWFFQPVNTFVAFENGSLFIPELGSSVAPSSYCLDYGTVLVCKKDSKLGVRVNRCCGDNAMYSKEKSSCAIHRHNKTVTVPDDIVLVNGLPDCRDYVLAGRYRESMILPNGSLNSTDFNTILPREVYCIEYIKDTDDDEPSVFACKQNIVQASTKADSDLRFTLYPIALALSVIFLAATLIASFLLPASHHVLHWRCQTNYVLCLLLGDILLCIVQFCSDCLVGIPCSMIGISMHFLFLSAFFWLNTMCFNIWWTFRDLRPQNLEKSQERCRLRLYEIYAWGFPALIAAIGLLMDLAGDGTTFYQPGFGKTNCWFHGYVEIALYFFLPVGILLTINLTLFAATARELTCGLWKRELVKSTTERAALGRVCIKLVVVMGIAWIADILSWIIGGPHQIWYFTDIINCLTGVFIFIVVGCQPQVLTAVKRYWCFRHGNAADTAGTTNHHSSTSQGQPSMGDTVCNHSSITNNTRSVALETSC